MWQVSTHPQSTKEGETEPRFISVEMDSISAHERGALGSTHKSFYQVLNGSI